MKATVLFLLIGISLNSFAGYYLKADSIYRTSSGKFLVTAEILYDNNTSTETDDVVFCRTAYVFDKVKGVRRKLKKIYGLKIKNKPALSKTLFTEIVGMPHCVLQDNKFMDVKYGSEKFDFASLFPEYKKCSPDNCVCISKCMVGKKRVPIKKLKSGKYRFMVVSLKRKEFATFYITKR